MFQVTVSSFSTCFRVSPSAWWCHWEIAFSQAWLPVLWHTYTEYKPTAREWWWWCLPYRSPYCFLGLLETLEPAVITGGCHDCVTFGMVIPTTLLSVIRCGTSRFDSEASRWSHCTVLLPLMSAYCHLLFTGIIIKARQFLWGKRDLFNVI